MSFYKDLMTDYMMWSQGLDFESAGPFPTMEIMSEDDSRQRHLAEVRISGNWLERTPTHVDQVLRLACRRQIS